MPDYSQVLNLCQLLNISVYVFLAGEFGAEARYMPKAREGSIQISSNNAAPAAAKAPDETPESPSPAPQESRKKKIATRFTEITLLLITGVLGIAVLLLGGIVIATSFVPHRPRRRPLRPRRRILYCPPRRRPRRLRLCRPRRRRRPDRRRTTGSRRWRSSIQRIYTAVCTLRFFRRERSRRSLRDES